MDDKSDGQTYIIIVIIIIIIIIKLNTTGKNGCKKIKNKNKKK